MAFWKLFPFHCLNMILIADLSQDTNSTTQYTEVAVGLQSFPLRDTLADSGNEAEEDLVALEQRNLD